MKNMLLNTYLITTVMVFITAAAISAASLYNRRKVRMLLIKNRQLEKDVTIGTEKLNQALIGLEMSRIHVHGQIQLLSSLFASVSHDVQSPLRYISFASKKIPELIQARELLEASKVGTMIFDLSEHMNTMLGQAIDLTKSQANDRKIQEFDLYKLVQEKHQFFADRIQGNNSIFENKISVGQTVAADYQLLSIIIHNLLDDAATYTIGGRIWASFHFVDEEIPEIVITNSAANFPNHIVEIINSQEKDQHFGELIDKDGVKQTGLIIIKEIAAIANISVTVSQTNHTSFHLTIPISGSTP